ncbi:global nitrogen regulator NtcA [soil metagenome]
MLATREQKQALIDLFKEGTRLEYKKGELIVRNGDTPGGVFFIESGLVKAYDITRYGEENLLIIRKPEEIFPIIWAITASKWHVMYEAMCPTVVYRLSREKYLEAITSRTELLAPLLDITLNMYRIQSQRIINLEYRTARERLVSFLIIMSDRFGKSIGKTIKIDVPLRQQDIASSINTSRETASRELSALEKKGLISMSKMHTTIIDMEKMRRIIE